MKEIVNKSFSVINARYRLTPTQNKIVLKIISMINNKLDTEFETYKLPLSTFDFLTEHSHYGRLKKDCKALVSKTLEIKKERGWLVTTWFSSIEYLEDEGIIECSIDPKLKPYLLELKKNFKYYELHYIMKMTSEYSIRIYELCKQSEFIKKRKYELKELHDILQVPKSYISAYKDFRIKVLEMAEKEINLYSDIKISFTPIRRSRSIHEIEFNIERNDKNIIEHKIEESQLKNEDIEKFEEFKVMFGKFGFNLNQFDGEFENFKLYNKNNIKKINIYNFEKWCMQKRRKSISDKIKVESIKEKEEYRWNFKKAKSVSDDIKTYLKFDLGINWMDEFYWTDKMPFKIDDTVYDARKVIHPDFNKDEYLLFVVDENDKDSKYLIDYKEEIIDV